MDVLSILVQSSPVTPMSDDTPRSGLDESSTSIQRRVSRRRFLGGAGVVGLGAVAGCLGQGDSPPDSEPAALSNFRGTGALVEERDQPGGTSIEALPDLEGTLNVYIGGGESGLYLDLADQFEQVYPDFTMKSRVDSSSKLASVIAEEADAATSPADLFLSIDVGSLVAVAREGATRPLSGETRDAVPTEYRGDRWVGLAGRARAMPYNTDALDAAALPDTVREIPGNDALANDLGWAPTYGAFQSFVTAMRLIRGEQATREWLTAVADQGVTSYDEESLVVDSVADGAIATGFANHYYALRVLNSRENAPVDLHFTSGDAGALINVAGIGVVEGTNKQALAENFVRHLLSAEAQEFFATRAFAYPTVPEVTPAGGLPSIEELDPPDIDLTRLGNLQPTLDLLRDTGVL